MQVLKGLYGVNIYGCAVKLKRAFEGINEKLKEYLIWYNTERAHQGLNWQTPMEYTRKQIDGPKFLPKQSNM